MAVQNTYLTTEGDLNQAKRKRAGESMAIDAVPKQTSFDVTNTPTPGNPGRAAQMQARFDQPVTTGSQPQPAQPVAVGVPSNTPRPYAGDVPTLEGAGSQAPRLGSNRNTTPVAQDMLQGAANLPVSVVRDFTNIIGTDVRNFMMSGIDAKPIPSPGYPQTQAAYDQMRTGAGQLAAANNSLIGNAKAGAREALDVEADPSKAGTPPALSSSQPSAGNPYIGNDFDQWSKNQPVQVAASPSAVSSQPVTTTPAANQPAGSQFYGTNIGQDAQGGQIAVRRGESGVPEFSNDPNTVAGAKPMPAGGIGGQLRTPGISNMADDVPLEQRGSINNIGNGIGGGLSVGAPGDAALALGRFERANQERALMINSQRQSEGGGRLTIIPDSSRAPSIAETLRDRQDSRLAQTEATRSKTQQSIMSGADELMTSQLNRQKTQQEIEAGQVGLEGQQRLAQLGAMLADPNLGADQRAAAERAYGSLSVSPADRFKAEQDGRTQQQKLIGDLYKSYSKDAPVGPDGKTPIPFDQWVQPALQASAGIGAGGPRQKVTRAEVGQTARGRGMTEEQIVSLLQSRGVVIEG